MNKLVTLGLSALTLGCIGLLSAACGGDDTGSGGSGSCSADYASIQSTIFEPKCNTSACHGSGATNVVLVGAAESSLIGATAPSGGASLCGGKTIVVAGDPSTSLLYQKVTSPTCGTSMPQGSSLTDAEKTCIKDWIASK